MCGIASYLSKNSSLSIEQFTNACNTLKHRGPDNTTVWSNQQNTVFLGHTRLSIIDFETGVQPIFSDDKNIAIIVNGEFYNHDEIRVQLMKEGFSFQTKSDSEILIPLYKKYGTNCLQYLNGEFAFILYDIKENLIFVGRDRFGIKPLHYTKYNGHIYFASEAKALIKMGVPAKLDLLSTFCGSGLQFRNNHSAFENILLVKPAHFLLISLETLDINEHKYWDLKYPQANTIKANYDEQAYIQEFARLFENAVKLRLRSDQPVGCYLSGGLDSSSVIGIMKKYSETPVSAFTIEFEDKQYNEGDIAIETSKFVGANQNILHITDKLLVDNFEDSIYSVEQSVFNTHGTAKYLLSKTARDAGMRVILTGEGADELLGGYIAFKIDDLKLSAAPNKDEILNSFLERNPTSAGLFFNKNQVASSPNMEYIKSKLGFIPQNMQVAEGAINNYYKFLKSDVAHQIQSVNPLKSVFDSIYDPALDGIENLNKSLYLWSKTSLPGYILTTLGDRMEMAHSIEGRPPFFDVNLVEFIMNLPVGMKIKNSREKYILREAMKDIITPTLYKREKFPYLAPVARNNNDLFYVYMNDMFNSNILNQSQLFDAQKVLAEFDKFKTLSSEEQTSSNGVFLNILSTLIVEKRFL